MGENRPSHLSDYVNGINYTELVIVEGNGLGDIAMPKNGFNTINCYRDKEMRNRTVYL
jgi:hypothetical protein